MELMLLIILLLVLTAIILTALYLNEKARREELEIKKINLESSQKSQQVKYGKNWEKFVPMMMEFEKVANKDNAIFVGMPIDYIVFDEDAVKFIEVKTGKSTLSPKQQRIKQQIENKNVEWKELRF